MALAAPAALLAIFWPLGAAFFICCCSCWSAVWIGGLVGTLAAACAALPALCIIVFVDAAPAPIICAAWASPAEGAVALVSVCAEACTMLFAAARMEAAMAPVSAIAEVVLLHDEGAIPGCGCMVAVTRAPA